MTTVYVVVCDCGLNGAWCEGVFAEEVKARECADLINDYGRSRSEIPTQGRGSYTGLGGADVVAMEVE